MSADFHLILTITAITAVVVLVILLAVRIRAERRRDNAIRRLDLTTFCDFLASNSLEGTIQVVAGKVSELLKNSFGCESIIFVRKRRGFFELSYYHHVEQFTRADFRFRFSRELAAELCGGFSPRPTSELVKLLPETLMTTLNRHGLDLCFPIFWRDNIYGIYFIKSNLETNDNSFKLLMAALAQSLSAAYHVKWHEQRLDHARRQLDNRSSAPVPASPETRRLVRLVRNRNAESVVRGVFEAMTADLGFSSAVLVYVSRESDGSTLVLQSGHGEQMSPLERSDLERLAALLKNEGLLNLDSITSGNGALGAIVQTLRQAGVSAITLFPVSPDRIGVLGWKGESASEELASKIASYRESAEALVQNAESFERARELSYTDSLTGLANQRYFQKRLREEIDRARRYKRSLTFIIFDMDDLKGINDRHGHQAGDAVIKRMAQILKSSIRAIDIIARYGGDEFCIIMPEADAATCSRFMGRLQSKIADSRFVIGPPNEELTCTISLGGAVFPDHSDNADRLVFAADMALLAAKESGRNSAKLYEPGIGSDRPASTD